MCKGHFLEAQTGEVELPEDSPKLFGILLEFLYTAYLPSLLIKSSYPPPAPPYRLFTDREPWFDVKEAAALADRLADLYILADKYQVQDLKEAVVKKLHIFFYGEKNPKEFFKLTHKIYQNVCASNYSGDNQDFLVYFSKYAVSMALALSLTPQHRDTLDKVMNDGGEYATDMVGLFIKKSKEDAETIRKLNERIEGLVFLNNHNEEVISQMAEDARELRETASQALVQLRETNAKLR